MGPMGLRRCVFLGVMILSSAMQVAGAEEFERYFENRTLRFDYLHTGTATSERFEAQRIIDEGPWSGRTIPLATPDRYGLYLFELYDQETNRLIFSEGFCSVFGEWQTVAEAREQTRSFRETVRMPWPRRATRLVMLKRDAQNAFQPIWEHVFSPGDSTLRVARSLPSCPVVELVVNGAPRDKVDLVILGDGYTQEEIPQLRADAEFFCNSFFGVDPFRSRQADFNVRLVEVVSPRHGIRDPALGYDPGSALGTGYGTFGTDRYVLTYDDWTVRDYAALAPYDFVVILLNSEKYGGGGIYNLYITAAARSQANDYVMVHEMAHLMAALADEYYVGEVAYEPRPVRVEPWEANVTALLAPQGLKWSHLVTPGTPIPTPWPRDVYERGGSDARLLPQNDRTVGAFEGASYVSRGMYRPEVNCIMLSCTDYFCAVCRETLSRAIDLLCRKRRSAL